MKKQDKTRASELYILFLAGAHNLIFADISLAGMSLRTLILLAADFLCIAVQLYKKELLLPHWKKCSVYEKTMTLLIAISVVVLAVPAFAGSDNFWIHVDIAALLLVYPCIHGRKSFPQDLFSVYSACSCVTCLLLLCYYLTGAACEPFVALLLQDDAVVSWLVLGIMMDMTAYCFEERGQAWYGGNILLMAFLLAIQKNIPAMMIAGIVPLLFPIFCRPSRMLACRAAQVGFLYAFLICNMSLITGYTPLLEGIVEYDLEISVYMELWLAVMGIWFYGCWDRYAQHAEEDTTVPQMREWYRTAVIVYVISILGILVMAGLFYADDASTWNRVAKIIINDIKENFSWQSALPGQMGSYFGSLGVMSICALICVGIVRLHRARRWRIKAHKLYRLTAAVGLLQAVFLPQTMASLPVYVLFFYLLMETEEEEPQRNTLDRGKWRETDETDHTDTLFQ